MWTRRMKKVRMMKMMGDSLMNYWVGVLMSVSFFWLILGFRFVDCNYSDVRFRVSYIGRWLSLPHRPRFDTIIRVSAQN